MHNSSDMGSHRVKNNVSEHFEPSWKAWLREGRQYLKAGGGEKNKFNNSILYNLLAMSLEKFVMAILGYNLSMPLNHTFSDLIYSLEALYPIDDDLRKTVLLLETKQEICSFEDYVRSDISDEDIVGLREAVKQFEKIAAEVCVYEKAPVILFG